MIVVVFCDVVFMVVQDTNDLVKPHSIVAAFSGCFVVIQFADDPVDQTTFNSLTALSGTIQDYERIGLVRKVLIVSNK